MGTLEGRLLPNELPLVMPVVERMPTGWRVQIIRSGSAMVFDVKVIVPDAGTHTKSFPIDAGGEEIARFLEWAIENPNPVR